MFFASYALSWIETVGAISESVHHRQEAKATARAIADSLNARFGPRRVVSVLPIPKSSRFVALMGISADEGEQTYFDLRLLLVRHDANNSPAILGQRRLDTGQIHMQTRSPRDYGKEGVSTARLCLVSQSSKGAGWFAVITRDEGPADCEPVEVDAFPIGSRFGEGSVFGSLNGASVFPPRSGGGMTIKVGPAWKVSAFDVFEWNKGHFVFANQRHPELFAYGSDGMTNAERDHHYPAWMDRAVIDGIHGRWSRALREWRRAEVACRKSLRAGDDPNSSYRVAEFYGDSSVIYKEIQRRIGWIRRGEFSHILLYRPYDFDLQVPPYTLGDSWKD